MLAAGTGPAGGADERDDLRIVDQGRSAYQITCARSAVPATLLAATELQKWVAQSTGVELPITAPIDSATPAIILRSDRSLPRDSFTIEVVGANLIITGHDSSGDPRRIDFERPVSTGTLYGVYEVLERYLGIRFYWPDQLGTIVPQHTSLLVPKHLEVRQAPHFTKRRLWKGPGHVKGFDEAASLMWGRRLRLGASRPAKFYHAFWRILNVEELVRRGHPEYAALVDGKRQTWYHRTHHEGQVCVSNPDVQAIFVAAARKSADAMVSMSPNDGRECHCECDSCRAWDSGRLIPDGRFAGYRDLSDRYVAFYNLVAQRSGRLIGGLAYAEYIEVPAKTKLHPNVTISLAINNAWESGNPAELARAERLYRAWGAYSSRTTSYDILFHKKRMYDQIVPLGTDLDRRIRLMADSGFAGAELYIAPEMELGGPDAYVAAKLLWDPDADGEQIREGYFRGLYGPGWREVQRLYQRAAQQWRKAIMVSRSYLKQRSAQLEVLPELQAHLHRAEQQAGNDQAVRQRLARLRRALERMSQDSGRRTQPTAAIEVP